MDCRCTELPILWAVEADVYADGHLVSEAVGEDGTCLLRCMRTGRRWVQDHPADVHGIRTLRLRWFELTPADVVAYLAACPGIDQLLLTMDPRVEHQPLPDAPVLHGVPELREYVDRYLDEEHPPVSAAMSVIERDDDALVLGRVSHSRGGQYVEHRPAAWIVTVRDARVVRVRAFSDWSRARRAAGMEDEGGDGGRRLGAPLVNFLQALTVRPAYRL